MLELEPECHEQHDEDDYDDDDGATTVAMSDLVESKLLLARTVVSD